MVAHHSPTSGSGTSGTIRVRPARIERALALIDWLTTRGVFVRMLRSTALRVAHRLSLSRYPGNWDRLQQTVGVEPLGSVPRAEDTIVHVVLVVVATVIEGLRHMPYD